MLILVRGLKSMVAWICYVWRGLRPASVVGLLYVMDRVVSCVCWDTFCIFLQEEREAWSRGKDGTHGGKRHGEGYANGTKPAGGGCFQASCWNGIQF